MEDQPVQQPEAPAKTHEEQFQEAIVSLRMLNLVHGRDPVVKVALDIVEGHLSYMLSPGILATPVPPAPPAQK